jgi:demethylmenaquinone methyltransferase/2-methoxy-6-polyprenyl-1,4-benzoquinol methylase
MGAFGEAAMVDFGFQTIPEEEKAPRVKRIFSAVASRYDLMNDLMSAGVHRLWKAAFVTWLAPRPGQTIVDCAGGTGDVAFRIAARARRGSQGAHVTVVDINEEMLRVGRARAAKLKLDGLDWIVSDAEALALPTGFADAYTIAFGIRNVTHRERVLAEARRVLKPGGRFMCLEFSAPVVPIIDTLYERYSFSVIPNLGRLVAGDADSYRYLVESIRRFPRQEAFAAEIGAAGFSRVAYRNFSGGVAAVHSGWAL